MFKRQNANVKVVLTKNALEFVTPLTLETLSQEPVYINQFDYENKKARAYCTLRLGRCVF